MQAEVRASKLSSELRFYQKQATEAMRARDSANADADQLKDTNEELHKLLQTNEAQLRAEKASHASLQAKWDRQSETLKSMRTQADKLPQALNDLAHSRADREHLRAERDKAQVRACT
jgi:chromosome segregation ATPase